MHKFEAITFVKKCERQLRANYRNADEKRVTLTLALRHCDPRPLDPYA